MFNKISDSGKDEMKIGSLTSEQRLRTNSDEEQLDPKSSMINLKQDQMNTSVTDPSMNSLIDNNYIQKQEEENKSVYETSDLI